MQRRVAFVAASLAGATWLGCTSSAIFGDSENPDTTIGSGGATSGTDVGGSSVNTGGSDAGSGCSDDLQYVVDDEGNVLETCWPDAGCSNGMCVPPCQAAGARQGSVSCSFTVATPHFYVGIAPPCFAVFVANNWPKAVQIQVQRGSAMHDVTQFGRIADASTTEAAAWPELTASGLPPGKVAVLFLSHDPTSYNGGPLTCPVPPASSQSGGTAVQGSGIGQAWRITTDIPVSAYDILPYGGEATYLPGAELILPTTTWADNYVAVTPRPSAGPPWGQLVAAEDATQIQILPKVSLPSAGALPAAPAQNATTLTLDAGEYIQWQLVSGQDMTGTIIQSNKPVSFTGGDAYICYQSATSDGGGCDSAHQMVPPIRAQAFEYVAMPHADRTTVPESIFYRVVGAVDGTQLTYDPPLPNVPTVINAGDVFDFERVGAFVVASQDEDHPFYLGQMMSGCWVGGDYSNNLGDEEYVNMPPPAQFLTKYVFFTDPTYPTTNLVITRVKTSTGFKDVNVDCLGTIGGWQPVGTSGLYEITNVDLMRLGTSNMGCTNGPHTAESQGPFGLVVWGLDTFSSYAYPAGSSIAPINNVVVPAVP